MKPLCSSLLWRIHFLPLCWTARERREPAGFSQSGCLLLPSQLVACNSPTSGPWFKGLSVTVVCLSLCFVGIQPASSFFLRWLHLLFHTTSFSLIFPVGMTLGCVIDGCSRAVEEQVCLNMALRSPSGVCGGLLNQLLLLQEKKCHTGSLGSLRALSYLLAMVLHLAWNFKHANNFS